jgi:RHS repeat-associated protein
VRQTLDDAGAVLGSVQYDPWGVPTAGTPQPFGFTGELHRAGQVYLRARWYAPGQGRFVSEDPFAGFPEMPYSLHAYQYGYSNPVRWTDPSGRRVNCFTDPPQPPDIGYIEGYSGEAGALIGATGGLEEVYDLYDFEYALFAYAGGGGFALVDAAVSIYFGVVTGWSTYDPPGITNYAGLAVYAGISVGSILSVGAEAFGTPQAFAQLRSQGRLRDGNMAGTAVTISVGPKIPIPVPPVNLSAGAVKSVMVPWTHVTFQGPGAKRTSAEARAFATFIRIKPLPSDPFLAPVYFAGRTFAVNELLSFAHDWDLWNSGWYI